jgi:hypothetical protein
MWPISKKTLALVTTDMLAPVVVEIPATPLAHAERRVKETSARFEQAKEDLRLAREKYAEAGNAFNAALAQAAQLKQR